MSMRNAEYILQQLFLLLLTETDIKLLLLCELAAL